MGQFKDAMDRELLARGFSPSTCKAYLGCMHRFVQYAGIPADQITSEVHARYLAHLTGERHCAPSTVNQSLSAISFFYREVLHRPLDVSRHYQRAGYRIPEVLTADEVRRLLASTSSLRDQALLEAGYGCGLRLSEVLHLRVDDVDSQTMTVRVREGKGRKDRLVPLPASLLQTLRRYWQDARPARPWVFAGPTGAPLHPSVVQRMFQVVRLQARLERKASFHTLRHSFATHMVEAGVDVARLRVLLGHSSLATTQRYMHISRAFLQELPNPLDRLRKK
jgi:integrase/recombinase XerD